jgi:hypothetical protein
MSSALLIQGRVVSDLELAELRALVDRNPGVSRYQLSLQLCSLWDWRNARGRPKDMAARTLMLKLERRGLLTLPPARWRQPVRASRLRPEPPPDGDIQGVLGDLRPLEWTVVRPGHAARALFDGCLEHYHYLGFRGHVGENLAYLVSDRRGRTLACMLFGAAAWKCRPRDEWIGWRAEIREQRLSLITAQTRFLILPWVRVPHLASHLLGRVVRRLAKDWVEKYGHPVHLVETFVDRERFAGTCYQAANWTRLGRTQGRGRQDRHQQWSKPVKDVYAYPLTRHFRERLGHGHAAG